MTLMSRSLPLRGLRISQAPVGKSQLLRELVEDRARGLRKLEKSFDTEATSELRKRLRRAEKDLSIPADIDPVAEALRLFFDVGERRWSTHREKSSISTASPESARVTWPNWPAMISRRNS